MEYKCTTVPMDKLISTPNGFAMPICQNCKTNDCDNPIEIRKVSIVGIKKDVKVFAKGNQFSFVVNCSGYTK